MKPTMAVQEGDRVRVGDPLFSCKKNPGRALHVAGRRHRRGDQSRCAAGAAVRGHRRGRRRRGGFRRRRCGGGPQSRPRSGAQAPARFGAVDVALRTRPFSKVPAPDHAPAAIFVTAMDTHPLAADPALIIGEQHEAFELGLDLLAGTDATAPPTCARRSMRTSPRAPPRQSSAPNSPVRTPRGCPVRTYTSCSAPVPRARCGPSATRT
jgi:hypothetical protein